MVVICECTLVTGKEREERCTAHVLEIADEAYQSLIDTAHDRGTTPQRLLEEWLTALGQQAVRRNGISESEQQPHRRLHERPDPWWGFLSAAEAIDSDLLERHDHYLVQDTAVPPAEIRQTVYVVH